MTAKTAPRRSQSAESFLCLLRSAFYAPILSSDLESRQLFSQFPFQYPFRPLLKAMAAFNTPLLKPIYQVTTMLRLLVTWS